ncbi:MAG: hypothetical protein LQ346_007830 [Caloplaca aetnensis]|nr:MAG: hypothetical protein LQ346_007830 [Caloplaca aetnensis]
MQPFIHYLKHILHPFLPQYNPSTEDKFSKAILANDVPALCSLFETQDRHLLTKLAQHGSPGMAAFILFRHPYAAYPDPPDHVPNPCPTLHPLQFLVREAAYNGNAALFRYLVTEHHLLTANRNVEYILINAITGGLPIWKTILEAEPQWKDHEFYGHRGVILEKVVEFGGPDKKELLQFLLDEGADLGGVIEPPLKTFRALGAGKDILEMVEKYC